MSKLFLSIAWLSVVDLLWTISKTSGQARICVELEFEGLNSEDKMISVTESTFVNLTFYLKTDGCQPPVNISHVKVSYIEKGLVTDLCNVLFLPHCNVSGLSPCRCLNSCCAQLFMKVSPSENRTYRWTWFSYKDRDRKKQREIRIHVIPTTEASQSSKEIFIWSTIFAGFVGITVAARVFRRKILSRDHEDY